VVIYKLVQFEKDVPVDKDIRLICC